MRSLFSRGYKGLSDTVFSGAAGSVYRSVGIDHRSKPGVLRPHQALAKHSSTTIDELCKVSVNVSDGSKLWFSSESGKIWREVSGTYTLVSDIDWSDFVISTVTDAEKSKDVSAQVNIPTAVQFKPDGTSMYIMGNATVSGDSGEIFQYTLSTAWDVSTASYASKTYVADAQSLGFFMKPDGTKFFVSEDGGTTSVIAYDLGTAWDISTASPASETYDFSTQTSRGNSLWFKPDGTKMYIQNVGTSIFEYDLSTAWDVTTASYVATATLNGNPAYAGGMVINSSGTRLYYTTLDGDDGVYQMDFGTAWDVTTLTANAKGVTASDYYLGLAMNGEDSLYVCTESSSKTIKQFSLSPEPSTSRVRDAIEWKVTNGSVGDDKEITNYIYFATDERLRRIDVTDIVTTWTPNVEDAGKFLNGGELHTMGVANNTLFIGDANILSSVSNLGVFTLQSGFNLPEGEVITAVSNFDIDTLIGTDNSKTGRVLRWDGISTDVSADDDIYVQGGVQAFISDDNYRYVIDGEGTIWFYNGEQCEVAYRIPEIGDGTIKVNPNAVGYWRKTPVFGVSNGSGDTVLQGIYALGKYSRGYDSTLSLDFPMPSGEFAGVEIGSIIIDGQDMYVSWKDGADVGVAKLDYTAKYDGAYIETMALSEAGERHQLKTLTDVIVPYYKKPIDTSISISVNPSAGPEAYPIDSVSIQANNPEDPIIRISQAGTKMIVSGEGADKFSEYTLSTPHDISTATFVQSFSTASQTSSIEGIHVSEAGDKVYVMSSNEDIYQYDLTTPWDVSTAEYSTNTVDVSAQTTGSSDMAMSNDGTKLYILDQIGLIIYQYTLSTAWDISTATYDSVSYDVDTGGFSAPAFCFSQSGKTLYVAHSDGETYRHELTTAWDISTASYAHVSFNLADMIGQSSGDCDGITISGGYLYFGWEQAIAEVYQAVISVFDEKEVEDDRMRKIVSLKKSSVPNMANPQLRIDLNVSGNNAPEIEDVLYDIAPLGKK